MSDPLRDRAVMVAKYAGTCNFCGRPTKPARSVTWLKVSRLRSGEVVETRKVGHFECYGDGASHLNNYSRR